MVDTLSRLCRRHGGLGKSGIGWDKLNSGHCDSHDSCAYLHLAVIFLILSGLGTGLSWICYFRALSVGLASKVAPVDKLSVIFAISLAAIFLHESVTWQQWVGSLFIVGGAVIIALF